RHPQRALPRLRRGAGRRRGQSGRGAQEGNGSRRTLERTGSMHARYLLSAALLGGIVSFGWGALTHNLLPAAAPHAFSDSTAVVQTVKANAPENGVYYDARGLFAAVAFHGDLRSRYSGMLYPIVHQAVICIVVAGLLAWVLLRLP